MRSLRKRMRPRKGTHDTSAGPAPRIRRVKSDIDTLAVQVRNFTKCLFELLKGDDGQKLSHGDRAELLSYVHDSLERVREECETSIEAVEQARRLRKTG